MCIRDSMDRLGLEDDQPIEHNMISKSIENAQTKVEGHNFDLRKHVVEYDDVMNKHREVIYAIRRRILEGENLHERMLEIIEGQIGVAIAAHSAGDDIDDNQIIRAYRAIVPMSTLRSQDISGLSTDAIEEKLIDDALAHYDAKERETGEEMTRYLERACLLYTSDAADERSSVDLGGRRIIKKNKRYNSDQVRSSERANTTRNELTSEGTKTRNE